MLPLGKQHSTLVLAYTHLDVGKDKDTLMLYGLLLEGSAGITYHRTVG
jgi:hypothetical protein